MDKLYITQATTEAVEACKNKLSQAIFLAEETRNQHTAIYPLHNRYFSNGDTPWVILINTKNEMKLHFDGEDYLIQENQLVMFDDNIFHAWEMHNNDLIAYYYRATSEKPVTRGTYCLDNYF